MNACILLLSHFGIFGFGYILGCVLQLQTDRKKIEEFIAKSIKQCNEQ